MGFLSQWKHYLDGMLARGPEDLERGRMLDLEKLEKVRPSLFVGLSLRWRRKGLMLGEEGGG